MKVKDDTNLNQMRKKNRLRIQFYLDKQLEASALVKIFTVHDVAFHALVKWTIFLAKAAFCCFFPYGKRNSSFMLKCYIDPGENALKSLTS